MEHTIPGRDPDTYHLRAEVGLLSRNIRIRAPPGDDASESYGPRVLVSTMVFTDEGSGDILTATGQLIRFGTPPPPVSYLTHENANISNNHTGNLYYIIK